MALSDPLDILFSFPGWVTEFEPFVRQQQSRQQNGVTRTKSFGNELWRLTAMSKTLGPNELDEWRARLEALVSGARRFHGYSLSRVFPIAYPKGAWPTGSSFSGYTAAVHAIGGDFDTVRVKQLPSGFQLSVGDFIRIDRAGRYDLHRVMEAVTASGGTTPEFGVFPALWPGVAVNDAVSVRRPSCLMTVVPGSITSTADPQTGRGTVGFQGMEAR